MNTAAEHIVWHTPRISRSDRCELNGHRSCVLWLTGYSGSGKSTLAFELERRLFDLNCRSYVLDGDNIRHGLNRNLGFSAEDRKENIRRISEVAKLFTDAGHIAITAFISPYREDRRLARSLFAEGDFIEVYVKCPIDECEKRDPKGLYKKARAGEIRDFTGISAPYEPPVRPEITIETDKLTPDESVERVLRYLQANRYMSESPATGRPE
ncbi:MAG: cysC [Paenibacillus sp.]|jgi:adenylylsulfate kinase|uniref:adenylyl-sulfate kinase n=1 Tax=Paenibacillus sp. GCM10012303 TaxID=3317340 RepID=UPI0029F02DFC|nr:cysC [Paenibacillus sp.]